MKILILKPSSLGDIVQAIPVLRLLRLRYPKSEIYWWLDIRFSKVLDGDKDLNGIIYFDRYHWKSPFYWNEVYSIISKLRKEKFDLVIDLQGLVRSGAFGWLVNGDLFIGVDEPREGANGFYDIIVRRPSYYTHAVDWYLETLRILNVPVHFNFDWLPPRREVIDEIKQKWNLEGAKYILIAPGGRWETKQWFPQNYVALVEKLSAEYKDIKFVVIGTKDSSETGLQIKKLVGDRCISLVGKTEILEMVELIRSSKLVICNDSGPMHIAAALKKPIVAIFGPTEPRRTGPYGFLQGVIQASLPCIPCFKRKCKNPKNLECLQLITPEMAVDKVRQLETGGLLTF